jgi:GDPmannose 4,6-dehydratase
VSKVAFITGITGQDGSLLAELLLEKGYEVYGTIRRTALYPESLKNIERIRDKLSLYFADLQNENHLSYLVSEIKPQEIYHMASQSDVRVSFDIPEYTGEITGLGTTRLLEAVRKFSPSSKVYNAASSEMFGDTSPPQNENTPMLPRSPYAAAKLYSFNMCRIYREAYGLFIASGICFNHECFRRGENFVTKKIVKAACEIARGKRKELFLGNLEAKRDWGYAEDFVKAMHLVLQQDKPDDFVIGTGEVHSVKEFVEEAFRLVGLDWKKYVKIDPNLYRPIETNCLCADARKAREVLGWTPSISFKELIKIMIEVEKDACQ